MNAARASRAFRAFSDPTRLRILHLLRQGELCVGDLVAVLRVGQPKASRHLRRLSRAGLVRFRKEGRWSFYSLAPSAGALQRRLLGCLASCFGEVPEMRADGARLGRLRKIDGCCGPVSAARRR